MSTEHQRYSIENQCASIAEYAGKRGLEVVKTYADKGKSGLNIERRAALKQLISDVQTGAADFDTVLVYDISRWGRFQDTDESAYYEFICTKAGIAVRYCAEPFDNDGSLISAILKSLKRAMAAEYSRELSAKIFTAQARLAKLGFKQGGAAAFGLRRLLVDASGRPKLLLDAGQEKALRSDRVVLVPGPAEEIATVRRAFELYVKKRKSGSEVAAMLNAARMLGREGQPWDGAQINQILSNEIYIGNYVYNRRSAKLKGRPVKNPPEQWVRYEGAVLPIVPIKLFEEARRLVYERRLSDQELLERLRRLLKRKGRLSTAIIDSAPAMPAANTYRARFGSLPRAYELIGYGKANAFPHDLLPNLPPLIRRVCSGYAPDWGVLRTQSV